MIYRALGRTGLKVSQLGFGAMRLPMVGEGEQARVNRELALPMIQRAFASGVNYIDTAVGYCNQDSQRVVSSGCRWIASTCTTIMASVGNATPKISRRGSDSGCGRRRPRV